MAGLVRPLRSQFAGQKNCMPISLVAAAGEIDHDVRLIKFMRSPLCRNQASSHRLGIPISLIPTRSHSPCEGPSSAQCLHASATACAAFKRRARCPPCAISASVALSASSEQADVGGASVVMQHGVLRPYACVVEACADRMCAR